MGIISNEKKQIESNFDITISSINPRVENKKIINNCWFKRSISNKFSNDKIFIDKSDFFICTEGTLLNAKSLMESLQIQHKFDLIRDLYHNDPLTFPLQLRGDFSGALYDKKQDSWVIFNNHIGSKPIFYYFDEMKGDFIFGTEFQMVLNGMKSVGVNPTFYEIGAYCLLSFGYMLGDNTLVKEIKKLPPGSILRYQHGAINIVQYYQLKTTPYIDLPDEEIIEELDIRFRAAIKAEYEKDLEHGYRHIATLSGGLDSRMNVCFGRKLGFSDILTICFSQSNYADEKIAQQIASDWGCSFLFSSLDNGNYLKDIETHVRVVDGLTFYAGAAHVYSMLDLIDWTSFGLLHTGQIGDLIMGSYLPGRIHKSVDESIFKRVATSKKLLNRIPNEIFSNFKDKYPNGEIFAFYERCVNGVFNGYRVTEQFSEFSSPFLYLDFFEYTMRIHPKKRHKEKIYIDWIKKKAPESEKYIWEKTGFPIATSEWKIFILKAIKHIRRKIQGPSPKDSMNPFDYWYKTNSDLRKIFEDYFTQHILLLDKYPQLKEDARYLFEEGNTLEKTQVLTLLAAVKLHNLAS